MAHSVGRLLESVVTMATTVKNKPYLKLSVEKRLALIEELLESVQKEWQADLSKEPLSAGEKAELDTLIEESDGTGANMIDLESACGEILADLETHKPRKRAKR